MKKLTKLGGVNNWALVVEPDFLPIIYKNKFFWLQGVDLDKTFNKAALNVIWNLVSG